MYTEDKNIMPRETIGEELLSRMLDSTRLCCDLPDRRSGTGCGCERSGHEEYCKPSKKFGLEGYPLASVYAPLQEFKNIDDKECALKEGTLFAELNLPFKGWSVSGGGCCHD